MNREIKFRAWDKDAEQMLAVDAIALAENVFEWGAGITDQHNDFHSMADIELMQFTGFHDENGVEIYEGDIIDFDRREWGGDDNIHKVSWDAQEGAWSWGGGSSSDMEWRTVIGNVFENPELLSNEPTRT